LYREVIGFTDLHEVHVHIRRSFQLMGFAVAVYYGDEYVSVFGHLFFGFKKVQR
jgi:hypothetical protein